MEPVYASVIAVGHALFAVEGLRFTVTGTEHVPRQGGAVVASNHLSYLDFAYAGLAVGRAGRRVRFMAKQEVFSHPVSGPLMRGMRHIPVDRAAGAGSFRAAVTALKAGEIVGVFPEATISQSFEPKEFKNGAVRMAAAAGVPVLPLAIWGSQRVWTKGHAKRLGRSKIPITLAIGEPILVPKRADFDTLTAALAEQITTLLHQAQDTYPPVPADELAFLPRRLGGTAPTPDEAKELERLQGEAKAASRQDEDPSGTLSPTVERGD